MAYKKLKLWFDSELAKMLAEKLESEGVDIGKESFIREIDNGVDALELKDRVEFIGDKLYETLDGDYSAKIHVLRKILGPENEAETGMFTEYYWLMPIAKIVEKYGLEHYDISLEMMLEITKRNTSEYAIRPFVRRYGQRILDDLKELTTDSNFHIRRLSIEGIRPRLPWATKLEEFIIDPKPILPLLEGAKDDTSRYVQKSVANCINDILKDNPDIAKQLLMKWSKNPTKQRKWVIKHAVRNSLKNKEQWAINLL